MRRLALLAVSVLGALALVPAAAADTATEQQLAARYAPVVRLVAQDEECGPGEPFQPTDVNALFGEDTVALRGPWNATDLVKVAPLATDLVGRYEYHLDYPGNALSPGCDYERWARRITAGTKPTVYAHVARDAAHPGELALQYWLFYPFNHFNNLHEGDWEMIQLVFDAPDAAAALRTTPSSVGYSSHEGAERAEWGDAKLELVDGTHPVVYPAAGSHANKFTAALYLGSSAEQGVGCDDTRGPHREIVPAVQTIPSDPAAARAAFPWITFDGRWGELQPAFYNGPTGPNLKTQWTEPITWAEDWRDRSYAVPSGGLFGTGATDLFCSGVARGSSALTQLLHSPGATLLALGLLAALVIFLVVRATWTPVAPLRLARRRTWGQTLSAAAAMYVRRPATFLGIGLVFIPLTFAIGVLQAVVLGGVGLAGIDTTGEAAGALALIIVVVGAILTVLGLALVQAATVTALLAIDEGAAIGPLEAYRRALRRAGSLGAALALAVPIVVVLSTSAIFLPVAIWLTVGWALLAQVIEVEGLSAFAGLARSRQLVHRRWLRVGSLVVAGAAIAIALGPLLGVLLIFATSAPLPLLNLVAGVVYALVLPFSALVASFVYFDARVRLELEPRHAGGALPAEIRLEG